MVTASQPELGIERLGGIDDLRATAVALFLAALGDVRHARMLRAR